MSLHNTINCYLFNYGWQIIKVTVNFYLKIGMVSTTGPYSTANIKCNNPNWI